MEIAFDHILYIPGLEFTSKSPADMCCTSKQFKDLSDFSSPSQIFQVNNIVEKIRLGRLASKGSPSHIFYFPSIYFYSDELR